MASIGRTIVAVSARFAISLLVTVAACNSRDPGRGAGAPAAACPPGDAGEPCTCPGNEVCPLDELVWLKCLDSGTWERTDRSCVLGLNCRASADCVSGQACCGDPYMWPGGTEITSSSCQPPPCSSDKVQLCQSSAECVQPGVMCGSPWLAYDGGSVSSCSSRP